VSEQLTESKIRRILFLKGYTFNGVTRFKTHDRIKWSNKDLKVSLNLGKKIENLTEEEFARWVL